MMSISKRPPARARWPVRLWTKRPSRTRPTRSGRTRAPSETIGDGDRAKHAPDTEHPSRADERATREPEPSPTGCIIIQSPCIFIHLHIMQSLCIFIQSPDRNIQSYDRVMQSVDTDIQSLDRINQSPEFPNLQFFHMIQNYYFVTNQREPLKFAPQRAETSGLSITPPTP